SAAAPASELERPRARLVAHAAGESSRGSRCAPAPRLTAPGGVGGTAALGSALEPPRERNGQGSLYRPGRPTPFEAPIQLNMDALHLRFRISRAGRGAGRNRGGDALRITRVETHAERLHVLLEPLAPLGAGDRDDVLPQRQEPGEGQLGRCTALLFRDRLDPNHELEVLREVGLLEARMIAPPVVGRDVAEAVN